MGKIKKITALNIAMVILVASLTACGNYDAKDVPDKQDVPTVTENATQDVGADAADEIISAPEEITLVPETYEDYMKLATAGYENEDWEIAHDCYNAAKELDGSSVEVYRGLSDTYLQMDDVIQALDVLDEGMEKCGNENYIDLLGQRKEYILAGMVAVGTNTTTNRYDDDGSILYECVWEGDTNGNEKRDQTVYYDEMGEIIYLGEHKYDRNGNQIEYKYRKYDSDGNLSNYFHKAWEYDADGKEVGNIGYDANDNIQDRTEYDYDTDGKLIRETCYLRDGEIYRQRVEEIEYDSSGNEIKREQNNAYGHTAKTVNTYDENGKLILRVKYNDNGGHIYEKIKYEYDENGNNIKEIHNKNPATVGYWSERDLAYWMEYKYDDFGSLTSQTMYENGVIKSEKQTSYEYHYIGNIDAEAEDYPEHYAASEEYNLKQRDIFTRFLNGEEKVRYYKDEYNVQDGKIVDETITDLIDFEYIRKNKRTLEYTFLDMTGDGIEELIIFSNGDHERLCVIQCSYGV